MRIATWNIEWFTHLFGDDNRLIADDGPSGREGVTRAAQAAAVAAVLAALDADAVLVVEAPDEGRRRSCTAALEGLAAHFGLRCRRALTGFVSASQQELALLYDPAALTPVHDPRGEPTGKRGAAGAPRFDGAFRVALEDGGPTRVVTFARPPLEILAETAGGRLFRMIGVHVKSKAPHAAKSPEQIPAVARENRRIQQGQCRWLRLRIEEHLAAGEPLVVLGDFNDGPGSTMASRSSRCRRWRSCWGATGRATCASTMPMPGRRWASGWRRRRPRPASSSAPNSTFSRPCSTMSWSRPTSARWPAAGASGIPSTTRPAMPTPPCARRSWTPPTTIR